MRSRSRASTWPCCPITASACPGPNGAGKTTTVEMIEGVLRFILYRGLRLHERGQGGGAVRFSLPACGRPRWVGKSLYATAVWRRSQWPACRKVRALIRTAPGRLTAGLVSLCLPTAAPGQSSARCQRPVRRTSPCAAAIRSKLARRSRLMAPRSAASSSAQSGSCRCEQLRKRHCPTSGCSSM